MQLWKDELKKSIQSVEELEKHLLLTNDEKIAIESSNTSFKITPHILYQIKYNDPNGKIRKQFIPSIQSQTLATGFEDDYLCETSNEVCDNLIVRYPHKAILLVTKKCPAYCQFCTRKRIVGEDSPCSNLNVAFHYLSNHPEIFDVVITGGEPLILDDDTLEQILIKLNSIKSIKFIRLNTRIPVTIPKRINNKIINLLKVYNVNYINIHFEHPSELSIETVEACQKLANNGFILGSQSVLLYNINNDKDTLKELFLKLLSAKVRPYYLYQCDKITGCQPFYVNPIEGIKLINSITDELPGLCMPRFVIDAPDKMGKITVAPNGLIKVKEKSLSLKNFHSGKMYDYKF